MTREINTVKFVFQIGTIKRLPKKHIYIIQNPYGYCQLKNVISIFSNEIAVDPQSCKFIGRLTALSQDWVESQFIANFAKIMIKNFQEFRGSTAKQNNSIH